MLFNALNGYKNTTNYDALLTEFIFPSMKRILKAAAPSNIPFVNFEKSLNDSLSPQSTNITNSLIIYTHQLRELLLTKELYEQIKTSEFGKQIVTQFMDVLLPYWKQAINEAITEGRFKTKMSPDQIWVLKLLHSELTELFSELPEGDIRKYMNQPYNECVSLMSQHETLFAFLKSKQKVKKGLIPYKPEKLQLTVSDDKEYALHFMKQLPEILRDIAVAGQKKALEQLRDRLSQKTSAFGSKMKSGVIAYCHDILRQDDWKSQELDTYFSEFIKTITEQIDADSINVDFFKRITQSLCCMQSNNENEWERWKISLKLVLSFAALSETKCSSEDFIRIMTLLCKKASELRQLHTDDFPEEMDLVVSWFHSKIISHPQLFNLSLENVLLFTRDPLFKEGLANHFNQLIGLLEEKNPPLGFAARFRDFFIQNFRSAIDAMRSKTGMHLLSEHLEVLVSELYDCMASPARLTKIIEHDEGKTTLNLLWREFLVGWKKIINFAPTNLSLNALSAKDSRRLVTILYTWREEKISVIHSIFLAKLRDSYQEDQRLYDECMYLFEKDSVVSPYMQRLQASTSKSVPKQSAKTRKNESEKTSENESQETQRTTSVELEPPAKKTKVDYRASVSLLASEATVASTTEPNLQKDVGAASTANLRFFSSSADGVEKDDAPAQGRGKRARIKGRNQDAITSTIKP